MNSSDCVYIDYYRDRYFIFLGTTPHKDLYRQHKFNAIFTRALSLDAPKWCGAPIHKAETKQEAKALAVGMVLEGYGMYIEDLVNGR